MNKNNSSSPSKVGYIKVVNKNVKSCSSQNISNMDTYSKISKSIDRLYHSEIKDIDRFVSFIKKDKHSFQD